MIFDSRICALGEGPLWHPLRQQLFWFDILGKRLLTQSSQGAQEWRFEDYVSAAGWIDEASLLIATSRALVRFDLNAGTSDLVIDLEADTPGTRSNDGRADPWGGFWIGTMGLNGQVQAGAIYRYYKGELRKLFDNISISNAICFAPRDPIAYFSDTPTGLIMRQTLDPKTGWPKGDPSPFIDLRAEGLNPDGAVVDADGNLWNAQWGSNRVAVYDIKGQFLRAVPFAGTQTSCPAFGGPDLTTLYCTTAADGLTDPADGLTYHHKNAGQGQAEHRVLL